MKPLLIIGASSFGNLMRAMCEDTDRAFAGFIDDFRVGSEIIGNIADLRTRFKPSSVELVMAVGYKHLAKRIELFRELSKEGFVFPVLKHPRAYVSRKTQIDAGSILMAGTNVDAFTTIGSACVLWPESTISHDNTIGDNTFISPSATLCGFVSIGESSFIGANSVVTDGSTLPPSSFVKAGSRYNNRALST